MEAAVSVRNLSVTLGGHVQALKKVSIDLPKGRTIGVIGPSGAGKTTFIKSIVGRLPVPKGSVQVLGEHAGTRQLRKRVTYMPQEMAVYPDATVHENVTYFATMAGIPRSQRTMVVKEVLAAVSMTDKASELVANLSGGQKQRVSLAIAMVGTPELMVLDEPTVGLDPVLRNTLWQLFNQLAEQGVTLIISSHSMDEAERCDDLVLLRDGEIIAHDAPADFKKRTKTSSVEAGFLQVVEGKKR